MKKDATFKPPGFTGFTDGVQGRTLRTFPMGFILLDAQALPELSMPEGEGSAKREELLRELSALEDGPLPELESSIAEQKQLFAKDSQVLDKLLSVLGAARLKMERGDGAETSSGNELKALQERIVNVRGRRVGTCVTVMLELRRVGHNLVL